MSSIYNREDPRTVLPQLEKNLNNKIEDVQNGVNLLKADYIVEQGTNYRKWNSGLAECWGTATVGSNSACSANYPITFISISSCVASCAYLSTGTYVAPTISVQPYTTYANFYARCSTSTTTSPHTVYWEVKGTWK